MNRLTVLKALTIALLLIPLIPTYSQEYGDEQVTVTPTSLKVGERLNITISNFPANTLVTVYIGNVVVGAVTTNSTGEAKLINVILPEMPGGTKAVQARAAGLNAYATLTVQPSVELRTSDLLLVTSVTYLGDGEILRVRGFGYKAFESVYIVDDATGTNVNPIADGRVVQVFKGTISDDVIVADANGSFDFSYKLHVTKSTGATVTVTVTGRGTKIESATTAQYLSFKAAGAVSFPALSPSQYLVKPGDTVSISISSFSGLRPDRKYRLLLDGSALSMKVDGTSASWFTTSNTTVEFTVPSYDSGLHSLAIAYYGTSTPLARHAFVISRPDTTPSYLVVPVSNGKPLDYMISDLVPQATYMLLLYNFKASESGVSAYLVTSSSPGYYLGYVPIQTSGAGYLSFTVPNSGFGTYALFLKRSAASAPPPIMVNIKPKLSVTPSEVKPGETITLAAYGLQPNAPYVIVWDALGSKKVISNSTFLANTYGYRSVSFEAPLDYEGEYAISVAPASNPSAIIGPVNNLGETEYPKVKLKPEIELDNSEYIPYQLVKFTWSSAPSLSGALTDVKVELNDTVLLWGKFNDKNATGVSSSASIYWSGNTITGSFLMPNGPADVNLVLKITAGTSSAQVLLKRVSGAGAILIGVDLAKDIAYLKTKNDEIATSLSSLNIKVDSISDDVVYLKTSIGTITAKLDTIMTSIEEVKNDTVTIATKIGDITAKIDNVALSIAKSKDDIIVKVDEVATKASEISQGISSLSGKIDGLDSTLAEIRGTVASQGISISSDVRTIKAHVSDLVNYMYIALILIAIAIIVSAISAARRR